jgi:hypothetical protein
LGVASSVDAEVERCAAAEVDPRPAVELERFLVVGVVAALPGGGEVAVSFCEEVGAVGVVAALPGGREVAVSFLEEVGAVGEVVALTGGGEEAISFLEEGVACATMYLCTHRDTSHLAF